MRIKRGDVALANLEPVVGAEQGKVRPVLVIQNNIANEYSPTTIIAPITSKVYAKEYPTNVFLFSRDSRLGRDSTVLLNQIRTIDKARIIKKISSLDQSLMHKIDAALKISLALT